MKNFLLSILLLLNLVQNTNAQYWEKDLPKGGGFHFETPSGSFYNVLSEASGSTTTFTISHITLYGDSIRSFTALDTNFSVTTFLIEQLSDSSFIVAGKTGNFAYASRLDYYGNMLWYDTLLIDDKAHYNDIAMINDSEFMLVGQTGEFFYNPYGLIVNFNINGTRGWINRSGYGQEHIQIENLTDSTYLMMSGWSTAYFDEVDTAGNITPLYSVPGKHPTKGGFINNNGTVVYRGEYYFSLRSAAAALRKSSDGIGTLDFDLDWATSPSTESYLSHHDNSFNNEDYVMVGNLHAFNGATNGSLGTFQNGFFVKIDTVGVIDYTKNYSGELYWCREINLGCYLIHMNNKLIMDCCGEDTIPVITNSDISICQGDSALIYGSYQNASGSYSNILISVNGCDSLILETTLIVNPSFSNNQNDSICQGNSILLYGTYQNTSGTYYDSLQTISGCDSIQSTTLTLNSLPNVSLASFNPDLLCNNASSVALPNGSPTGGSYTGNGVVGGSFDPSAAGIGTHDIIYTYTDGNSCINSDTTIITVDICTGIDNISTYLGIIIYPNPNTGLFTIEKPNGFNKAVGVKLLDVTSKLLIDKVMTSVIQKIDIDITNYSQGIYYLQLTIDNEIFVKQILKDK